MYLPIFIIGQCFHTYFYCVSICNWWMLTLIHFFVAQISLIEINWNRSEIVSHHAPYSQDTCTKSFFYIFAPHSPSNLLQFILKIGSVCIFILYMYFTPSSQNWLSLQDTYPNQEWTYCDTQTIIINESNRQLRTRRALTLFNDVPLRTRRTLLPQTLYSDSALLVLNGTSLNSVTALLALNWWNTILWKKWNKCWACWSCYVQTYFQDVCLFNPYAH